MRYLIRRIRTAPARRKCRRHGHDWGPWLGTWVIFVQGRRCRRCGLGETRTPWDGPRTAIGSAVLDTFGVDPAPKAGS